MKPAELLLAGSAPGRLGNTEPQVIESKGGSASPYTRFLEENGEGLHLVDSPEPAVSRPMPDLRRYQDEEPAGNAGASVWCVPGLDRERPTTAGSSDCSDRGHGQGGRQVCTTWIRDHDTRAEADPRLRPGKGTLFEIEDVGVFLGLDVGKPPTTGHGLAPVG
ncbi:hypothetical protein [Streptomyces sp. NPDC059906]|uniref:hypothetical protein n=1 Tax=Streptomyces sp. NPDC059906 TaxID=3346997 RepID=UPI0036569E26